MTNTDNMYGFDNSNDYKPEPKGLPIGTYKVMILSEESTEDNKGFIAEYEVLDGDYKGKKAKVWYLTKHENKTTADIAKNNIKRIADSTGKAVSPSSPLKGRVLTVTVKLQTKNPDYSEIVRYHPEDYKPEEKAPF